MAEAEDELLGTLVGGRYRVIKKLGEGGMGAVYLAEHEAIEKKIALKVLHQEYSRKEDIVTRFQQEAISASRIKHPNVLDVFDFGKLDNGSTFLAMEFLRGRDMADELEKFGPVDSTRGIRIALQICRALFAAHKAGVVHRDMKPDNVFLQHTDDGEEIVKIVDFGIAQLRDAEEGTKKEQPTRRRLTKTGMIFGTPEYMSPEQAAGKKADQRVDVYAVGIILYEMFTGAVPFTGESFMEVLSAHLNQAPPPMTHYKPDLPISYELQNVIMMALSKSPDERYATMGDFATAIMATPEGQLSAPMSMMPGGDGRASMMPSIPPAPRTGVRTPNFAGERATAATAMLGNAAVPAASPPANTQLNAETTVPPDGNGKGKLFGLIGAAAVAAGAIGFALMPKGEETASGVDPAPTASVAIAPVQPPPALPTPPKPAPPKVEAAPAGEGADGKVTLRVQTNPPGGSVSKGGFQACDTTPCELRVVEGETLELEGKKGTAVGTLKLLAQEDKLVTIELKHPTSRRPTTPSGPKMCEVDVGGLKILRPCK